MKLKLDDKGAVVVQNGKPVYILDDGREVEHDAAATVAKITELNSEAKNHRVAKEAAEAKLKTFDGIEDGAAALAALTTVKSLSGGELKTAAQVKEITDAAAASAKQAVADATRAAEAREKELAEANQRLTGDLNNHIIGGSFASSKFISEKLAIPADIAQKFFGDRFKVEGGKLVPMGVDGNPIFSATNHGNHADFDEAMQVMVNQYANKDAILKGTGAGGGGAKGGGGGGSKTISRQQFESMDPVARAGVFKDGMTVTD